MAIRIILDAGHGGRDSGAVFGERVEKDDNLEMTLAVGRLLEEQGFDVVYIRQEDIYQPPFQKATIANESPTRIPSISASLIILAVE